LAEAIGSEFSGFAGVAYRYEDIALSQLGVEFCSSCADRFERLAPNAERFKSLIEQIQKQPQQTVQTISWSGDTAEAESFHAIPLLGRNKELLGVLLVGSSRRGISCTYSPHCYNGWCRCCCCDLDRAAG